MCGGRGPVRTRRAVTLFIQARCLGAAGCAANPWPKFAGPDSPSLISRASTHACVMRVALVQLRPMETSTQLALALQAFTKNFPCHEPRTCPDNHVEQTKRSMASCHPARADSKAQPRSGAARNRNAVDRRGARENSEWDFPQRTIGGANPTVSNAAAPAD